MRHGIVSLTLLLLLLVPGREVDAGGGPPPGRPVWPEPGQTDAQLYAKAMRLQSRMWWHLSPEGLLVEVHRWGADEARLSHDAIGVGDAAIWTGCYAASQACRWAVTRDPDALRQVRHLARGLALLTKVTGRRGSFARTAGRPLEGRKTHGQAVRSRAVPGMLMRTDVSRDQLAGVTLGWYQIWRHVDDPELRELAADQMADIALRLRADGMWLTDHLGRRTKHGEMRPSVKVLRFMASGSTAAIGLAAVLAASEMNRGRPRHAKLRQAVAALDGDGWDEALGQQHTNLRRFVLSPSNVNMTTLSLTALARSPHASASHQARIGLNRLRKATVGWWNAGFCACHLYGNPRSDRKRLIGELRATLHAMPEYERPPARTKSWRTKRITPVWTRSIVSGWTWKEEMDRVHEWPPGVPLHPTRTHTRADWLFAYWLARAAGVLQPASGPGREPKAHACPMDDPPWMKRDDGVRPRLPAFGGGG